MTNRISDLISIAKDKYGSLAQPDYSFIKTVSESPYDALIEDLRESFEILHTTDLNDDVCYCYTLLNNEKSWFLELSLLGKFAAVFQVSDRKVKVLDQITADKNCVVIFDLLTKHDFSILSKSELETHCPANLYNTSSENVRIYQLFFTDTDVLPWQVSDNRL